MKPTAEQLLIINAPSSAKIFVEAQPGTGKTAVACARVIKLLHDGDIPPSSIMMISFTRTAVAEMKNRIRQTVSVGEAGSINIATLDQTAFSFGIGCGQEFQALMGSFDDNIENAIKHMEEKNETLLDYIGRLRHVIIDEAQDITGLRIRFLTLLLNTLTEKAGVTVFADRSQAIYGFTNDLEEKNASEGNFVESFNFLKSGYKILDLKENHRISDPELLEMFCDTRNVLSSGEKSESKPALVIEQVKKMGKSQGNEVQELPLKDGDLVLFRKRASALIALQYCQIPFRLRLPGYPAAVYPWIGYLLWDWTKPVISRSEFEKKWAKLPSAFSVGLDEEKEWNLLIHFAQDRRGNIDLEILRSIISRPRPPVELCQMDFGEYGPIFSTIHASKGRESDRVFLMLPRNPDEIGEGQIIDLEEEARVYYVGATRVKKEFFHGIANTMIGSGRLDASGRRVVEVLSLKKRPKFQFGLAGDIDESAVISRYSQLCLSEKQAVRNHESLISMWKNAVKKEDVPELRADLMQLKFDGETKYLYIISLKGTQIAWSAKGLGDDLWATANKLRAKANCGRLKPPDEISPLRMIGLRTCAVRPKSALEGLIHKPFSESGFFLAPMIVGYPSVFFKF